MTWAAALPAATYAASTDAGGVAHAAAAFVYLVGSAICHQRPERSFELWVTSMPVCARCAGIYIGAAAAVLCAGLLPPRFPSAGAARNRAVLLMAAAPAVATLIYEWVSGVTPANWLRAATGIVAGAGVATVIRSSLATPAPETDAVN